MFSGLLEEKVWTTLKNNLSPQTSVTNAEHEGKAVLHITYNVTDEQVHNVFSLMWFTCSTISFVVVEVHLFLWFVYVLIVDS